MTDSRANIKPQLLWLDLELTGLHPSAKIIEIATLLTDYALTPVPHSEFHRIVACGEEALEEMGEWCTRTHEASGLTRAVKLSKKDISQVERELLAHLLRLGCTKGVLLLSGNSIHADRMFLGPQMPRLLDFLHYRQIDVSTIKSLAAQWNPEVARSAPVKKLGHRAMDDIMESIAELRHYRETWLTGPEKEEEE